MHLLHTVKDFCLLAYIYLRDESPGIHHPPPLLNIGGGGVRCGEGDCTPTAAEDGLPQTRVSNIQKPTPILQHVKVAQDQRTAVPLANLTQLSVKGEWRRTYIMFMMCAACSVVITYMSNHVPLSSLQDQSHILMPQFGLSIDWRMPALTYLQNACI